MIKIAPTYGIPSLMNFSFKMRVLQNATLRISGQGLKFN